MNDSIFRISLDIHEHGSQAVLKAKYADTGRKLYVSLRSGSTPYIISDGCSAAFKATKQDGTILYNACTIEENEIIYEFTPQTCSAVGRSKCEIALYGSDDKLITSPRFALLVDGTIYPDGRVESTDEFSALTELVSDTLKFIEGATEATEKANESTEDAKVATQNANKATETANQAATAATQATQSANTATENANVSANRANEATQAANSAASAANLAAENANETVTNVVSIVKNTMAAGKVAGESVSMDDAVEFGFIGCRIFGKTTQNGTPTPDNPVDLVSIGDSGSITVNVSGENDAQNMTIATPNGLPGIQVESGGNYTDANGQQWICDEKDFARGVYVHRVNAADLGAMDWNYASSRFVAPLSDNVNVHYGYGICSHYPVVKNKYVDMVDRSMNLNDMAFSGRNYVLVRDDSFTDAASFKMAMGGVKLVYIIATPIETPLSEEELAAYSALHTYRDNTTVSNDAGAYMELEYVMDSKKYIDSKIASSILTATVE